MHTRNSMEPDAAVRTRRDVLLAATDWTQMPDAPLTEEQKLAWTAYRQALRDVPQQVDFPQTVIWPQRPDGA
jgi:hypothetical protein